MLTKRPSPPESGVYPALGCRMFVCPFLAVLKVNFYGCLSPPLPGGVPRRPFSFENQGISAGPGLDPGMRLITAILSRPGVLVGELWEGLLDL